MKNKNTLATILSILATGAVLAGCSNTQEVVGERKDDLDKQKDAQKATIEERTEALKQGVELETEANAKAIDMQKKELDLEKAKLDSAKSDLKKAADLSKKNLDKQAAEYKRTVEHNADVAKAEWNDYGRAKETTK